MYFNRAGWETEKVSVSRGVARLFKMRGRQEIKNKLIDRLVEDDLLDEFDLDNKIEIEDDGADSAVKLKRLELQQEMEMAN